MADLSTDGYLDKFELGLRHNNVADFYIDSIKVKQVEDTVAPVINYEGRDNEIISQGQTLNFKVSAIDAVQGEVDVELIWGDSSRLDENGNPLLGTHTLTFRATDYFGNTANRTITVTVIESDSTAPEFTIPTDKAYVKTGTTPCINVIANDNVDGEIEVVQSWSENALNQYGELNEGTHVLTLTATDSSNNKTVKTITFYVTKTGDSSDVVVDEEELCPEEESESESEEESEEESTSSKESSSQEDSATSKDSQESKSGSSAGCTGSMNGFVGIFSILIIAVIVFILIRRRRY